MYLHTRINVSLRAFKSIIRPGLSNTMPGTKEGLNKCSVQKGISKLMLNQEDRVFLLKTQADSNSGPSPRQNK